MKQYRDLTGDDVVQAKDKYQNPAASSSWFPVNPKWFGKRVCEFGTLRFKRKLTPAEITAAERVRFEASMLDLFLQWSPAGFHRMKNGQYADPSKQVKWEVWCKAVGCDPMGDVGNG